MEMRLWVLVLANLAFCSCLVLSNKNKDDVEVFVGLEGDIDKIQGIWHRMDVDKARRNKVLPNAQRKLQTPEGTYYLSSEKTTWPQALQNCRRAGMELVSVETRSESAYLARALGTNYNRIWSSGTDLGSDRQFYWSASGKTFGQSFINWAPGEFARNDGREHCVPINIMNSRSPYLFLYDERCDLKHHYMCEVTE